MSALVGPRTYADAQRKVAAIQSDRSVYALFGFQSGECLYVKAYPADGDRSGNFGTCISAKPRVLMLSCFPGITERSEDIERGESTSVALTKLCRKKSV